MSETTDFLDVDLIDYDANNPRVKQTIEKYGENLTSEKYVFALRSALNSQMESAFESLRDSIQSSGGIIIPIVVTRRNSRFVCIDGNARLAIYKHFLKQGALGDWSVIKSILLDSPTPKQMGIVRMAAHLTGTRQWPPFEKARYLHDLRGSDFMMYAKLVALCGGGATEIGRQIDAYADMKDFCGANTDSKASRDYLFSSFVELQRPRIKLSIFEAGLDVSDFGTWIQDGKIRRLADIRDLPRVLNDEEARSIFLAEGARAVEKATEFLDRKEVAANAGNEATLKSASILQCTKALSERIKKLPFTKVQDYQSRSRACAINELTALENLADQLQSLMRDVSK